MQRSTAVTQLAVLICLITACGSTVNPTSPRPTAVPTPTVTGTSPTPHVTASPTAQPTETLSPAPTPIPTPTPIDFEGWKPLLIGGYLDPPWLSWAPDSRHVLVAQREFAQPTTVNVFSREGEALQTFVDFQEAVWLDDERLVLTRYPTGARLLIGETGQREATSFIGVLGSEALEDPEQNLAGAKSNGAGALAIRTCWVCRRNVGYYREVAFRTWTPESGLSDANRGSAIRWSQNGDRLLVEHPLESGPGRDSWWEILSYPEMTRFSRGGGTLNADFTKTARYWPDPEVINVTDLVSRDTWSLTSPFDQYGAQWDASGSLLVNGDGGDVALLSMDGTVTIRWDGIGYTGDYSANETTHVFWYDDSVETTGILNVLSRGVVSTLHVPGQLYNGARGVTVSPDGTALIVITHLGGKVTVLMRDVPAGP